MSLDDKIIKIFHQLNDANSGLKIPKECTDFVAQIKQAFSDEKYLGEYLDG